MVSLIRESYNSFLQNSETRRGWIDYARGIAIILVVYKHILLGFVPVHVSVSPAIYLAQEFFYNLRMPLFFIVSGIFIRNSVSRRSALEFSKYKFSTILYPYLIWTFIQVTLKILAGRFANFAQEPSVYFDIFIRPRSIDHFWYLYTLFTNIMIFAFLYWTIKANRIVLLFIGLLFYSLSFFVFEDYFSINDILFYFLFLIIGDCLSPFILSERVEKILSSGKTILIMLPFFVLSQSYWLIELSGIVRLTELQGFHRVLCIPMVVMGCIFLLSVASYLNRIGTLKWLQFIGKHSLFIYILHIMVIGLFRWPLLRTPLVNHPDLFFFVMMIISIATPIIIYLTFKRLKLGFLFFLPVRSSSKASD
jgi:fucose 4-O-acetylase-like acetyltransferase